MSLPPDARVAGSFRDPSGFLFHKDGILYRRINASYEADYRSLLESGLYDELVKEGLLIPHQEVSPGEAGGRDAWKVIRPEWLPFISYPYEWCFSQLQDAALATLQIQKAALGSGMSLKDASAYNIQFRKGRPVLIDTLSFERYREGRPWVAYRQFCQHFLIPLALMSYRDARLSRLLQVHLDGIPLDLGSRLLPLRTWLLPAPLTHIHLHARSQSFFADGAVKPSLRDGFSKKAMLGLIEHLASAVRGLRWRFPPTEWGDYYRSSGYGDEAFESKRAAVTQFLRELRSATVWDLGANTGVFSRIAAGLGIQTVAFDLDPAAVEKNYLECRRVGETRILPLWLDLANPSPAIGWENSERQSLAARGPSETILALALVHHLAISNNLPLARIASFLRKSCRFLILEFVPKSDPQARRLLSSREDIFPDYDEAGLRREFSAYFSIDAVRDVVGSERKLFLMRGR